MADLVVIVAGNICSGKSTITKYIRDHQAELEEELGMPLKIYAEFLDQIARGNFYEFDDQCHTANFEFSSLFGRIVRHHQAKKFDGVAVFDRGLIEGAEIFAKNSYESGRLRRNDYDFFLNRLSNALDDLDRANHQQWLERLVIHLEVRDTDVLVERNKMRAEIEGTEIVDPTYLHTLNERYAEFMQNVGKIYPNYGVPAPEVLTIDASVNTQENPRYLNETVNTIISRMKEMV